MKTENKKAKVNGGAIMGGVILFVLIFWGIFSLMTWFLTTSPSAVISTPESFSRYLMGAIMGLGVVHAAFHP
jgi:hypothetical protein